MPGEQNTVGRYFVKPNLMIDKIDFAVEDLQNLESEGFYAMNKISWWLLKYEIVYTQCKATWNNNSCYGDLPCSHTLQSPENKFCDLYRGLDMVTKLHKYEDYLEYPISKLNALGIDSSQLKAWLLKYEKLGSEKFLEFWTDWYEKENNYIQPFILNWQNLNIKLNVNEWGNTITFLHHFNKYYWKSDICHTK